MMSCAEAVSPVFALRLEMPLLRSHGPEGVVATHVVNKHVCGCCGGSATSVKDLDEVVEDGLKRVRQQGLLFFRENLRGLQR
jgi:hypothetical protein